MKSLFFVAVLLTAFSYSQNQYSVSDTNPYGLPNPDAPEQMTWEWKYIMNGTAIQDETLKEDGSHSGSIRQFIADSSKWYVHWYSSKTPSTTLPTWEDTKKENGNIVLYRDQTALNGMEGFYRLTFYDISDEGYKWIGEWTDKTEKVVFPTWKIDCKKQTTELSDLDIIKKNTEAFSQAYMDGDIDKLVNMYTADAKIFPNNRDILSGEQLANYWVMPEDVKILHHKITSLGVTIENDTAYDYGYYEGKTLTKDKEEVSWQGKHILLWKKVDGNWKIYLDIWNSIKN